MRNDITTLDSVFSEYIRRRDADKDGFVRCISCGRRIRWEEADCGHFVPRANIALRFDEQNCNAQCRTCNRFKDGNSVGYARGIVSRYGAAALSRLRTDRWRTAKLTRADIAEKIRYYKNRIHEITQQ